jgi:CheY-like chemotaxis protein
VCKKRRTDVPKPSKAGQGRQSESGQGKLLPLYLALPENDQGAELMNRAIADNARTVNILLVDDDDGDAKSVDRAFGAAKIVNPVVRAFDGVDALDILRGTTGRTKIAAPYLLLVDLNMPRMNGIELVQALRQDLEFHSCIVFMLTTSIRDEDKVAAYDLNVAGYVLKQRAGYDFQKLVDMVRGYWRIVELP